MLVGPPLVAGKRSLLVIIPFAGEVPTAVIVMNDSVPILVGDLFQAPVGRIVAVGGGYAVLIGPRRGDAGQIVAYLDLAGIREMVDFLGPAPPVIDKSLYLPVHIGHLARIARSIIGAKGGGADMGLGNLLKVPGGG